MTYTLLSCIDSKLINFTNFYGKFELGPFSSGQSLTVANTLRRCLLSELPGTAIILVEINGADHEYDTLLGIRECTLDILLNLKQIVFKSDFELYEPQIGFLNKTGPSVIRARDLNLPFFISCIDPDQYIATLTNKGKLNLKFLVIGGKKSLTHTPSSDAYKKWVSLLKKARPSALPNLNKDNNIVPTVYQKWKENQTKGLFNFSFEFPSNDKFYYFLKPKKVTLKKNSLSQSELIYHKDQNNKNIINSRIALIVNSSVTPMRADSTSMLTSKKNLVTSKRNAAVPEIEMEGRQLKTNKIGYFPIDVSFSPIIRVNYTIELKNHLTNQETIFLELWTNGSIDPRSAIHKTVKNLIQLLLPLQQLKSSFFLNSSNISLTHRVFIKKKNTLIKNYPPFRTEKSNIILKKINRSSVRQFLPQSLSQSIGVDLTSSREGPPLDRTVKARATERQQKRLQNQDKHLLHQILKKKNLNLIKLNDLFVIKPNKIINVQNKKNLNLSFTSIDGSQPQFNQTKKLLLLDIINLSLSPKLYSLLKGFNIHKIKDLLFTSKKTLLDIPNMTPDYLKEIQWVWKKYNFLIEEIE